MQFFWNFNCPGTKIVMSYLEKIAIFIMMEIFMSNELS